VENSEQKKTGTFGVIPIHGHSRNHFGGFKGAALQRGDPNLLMKKDANFYGSTSSIDSIFGSMFFGDSEGKSSKIGFRFLNVIYKNDQKLFMIRTIHSFDLTWKQKIKYITFFWQILINSEKKYNCLSFGGEVCLIKQTAKVLGN